VSVAVVEGPAAAVYERELDASVERIWENVLDWEHLPYLHPQAFTSVRMDSQSRDHWSGVVGLPGSSDPIEIDVRLDRPSLRYTTRTVAGVGAGTAIVTSLFPREAHRTGIRVDFHLPWAPPEAAAHIGEVYQNLYVQLWDQDEDMMRERQRVLDGELRERQRVLDDELRERQRVLDSVSLGRVRELASRLPLDVELGGRRFRVVSIEGRLHAYDVRCPHLGGPLPAPASGSCEVACPWHGYRFDLTSNASSDGRGLRLRPAAVVEVSACDGEVRLRLP
jgi:nitrite reductase/ring-hydroxylating ferredoxin subunit